MAAWLFAPTEKPALLDVAKLAAALRSGAIEGRFLDGGDVALGTVSRVTLLGPGDLGLASSQRKFVLARGSTALCLAEVIAGEADLRVAEQFCDAVSALRLREPGRTVIGWLVAERILDAAAAKLSAAGMAITGVRPV